MGLIMKKQSKYLKLVPSIVLFIGLPLLLYALGDFPRKSVVKEILSIVTMIAFFAMLAQFYFTRHNKHFNRGRQFSMAFKIHKYIGYIFVIVLLLHPFFIVLPRFFEAGIAPRDAFLKLITEFSSLGVVLGLMAYAIILLILITTFFRNKFDLKYKIGRMFHGYVSVLFLIAASWHVIDIGSHSNIPFSVYIILVAAGGIFHLFQTYFQESQNTMKHE